MFDLITLIKTVGYLGIAVMVFAESGLFFGFFFPGDSLLFTAGFLASQNIFNIWLLVILVVAAAILGVSAGYIFGRKVGPLIFTKEDSFFFHKHHIERARRFFEKYGKKAIVIARFMPIVRTFTPILAGVGQMDYPPFLLYNAIGGLLWGAGLPFLGYFLGNAIPNADQYLLPIVAGIIILSFVPTIFHYLKER